MGSYKDKTFLPDNRIIIGYYKSRESLLKAEENLQKSLNVAKDPQYANRSIQTSTGFNRQGFPDSPETRERKSKSHTGKKRSKSQVEAMTQAQNRPEVVKKKSNSLKNLGDAHPSRTPESRLKASKRMLGENNPMYGKPGTMRGRTGDLNPLYGTTRPEEYRQHMSDIFSGENNPCFGKRWWVNNKNETLYQENSPGADWQRGRKWKL
jgi:hypothetical protein